METALILAGVACIIGAIIGGGVKFVQIELSPVNSRPRQLLLGAFGLVLVISGLVAGGHLPFSGKREVPAAPPTSAGSQSQSKTSSPPRSLRSLPSKVDVFWCLTDDGGAMNENTAVQIVSGLRATKQIAHLRVRLLPRATNAKPGYRIFRNIVRYDPGEFSAAEEIARLAAQSSGATFEPAPALPGSPSIDYLSVFVCAPR